LCGIVGIASASVLTDQLKKVFNDMLYFDVVRGEDSTGVAAISSAFSPAPKVEVLKSVGSATDFFYDHCKYAKGRGFTQSPPDILIGHNRYATQGAVNIENAHPFEFDNVVGVHNGTVQKWSMRKFHGYKDFEVDSQIIYSHLSHSGSLDEVWKDADGAMALVYWDKVNKQLNIIRNKERPMNIFYTEDNKAVLWSSEYWMASVAAMRHGVKLRDPVEVKPDRLFTFSKGDNGDICHVERDLPPFVEKVQYHQNYGRGYWQGYDDWLVGWKTSQKRLQNLPLIPNTSAPSKTPPLSFVNITMSPIFPLQGLSPLTAPLSRLTFPSPTRRMLRTRLWGGVRAATM